MFWALSTIQPFTFTFTLGAQDQQQLGKEGGEPGGQAGGGHHQTGKRDPAWSQEKLTWDFINNIMNVSLDNGQ